MHLRSLGSSDMGFDATNSLTNWQILPSCVRAGGNSLWMTIFRSLLRCLMSLKAGLLVGHLGSSESCPEVTPVFVGYVIWAMVLLDSDTLAISEILRTLY